MVGDCYPRPEVDQEGKYLDREGKAVGRESVLFALLDREKGTGQPGRRNRSTGKREPVNREEGTGQPVPLACWPMPQPVHHFLPENLSFYVIFSSNT